MTQKLVAFLKGTGSFVLVIAFSTAALFIFVLFFAGAIRLYTHYLSPFLEYLDGLAFVLSFLFLFLCIFRRCRMFAGTALVYCSWVIGIDLWFQSLVNTYVAFGGTGIFIGIVLLGVGIYFTGLAALLWAHLFGAFWSFAAIGVFMMGIRAAGLHIAQKEAERRYDPDLDEPDADGITGRMLNDMKSEPTQSNVSVNKEIVSNDSYDVGPYLSEKDLETRRIAFVHCEDEACGFVVEFKHSNCTFYFCQEHGTGFNLDLNTVSAAGVECELHGKMQRYDLLAEYNLCPKCEESTLAILSVGK